MDIRKSLATLLYILFCNKWTVLAEITGTDKGEVKTTEHAYTTPETSRGLEHEHQATTTNIAIVNENKTAAEQIGFESTTVDAEEIEKDTQIIKSTTQSSKENVQEEEVELMTLLLNLTVVYCHENMCEHLDEPPTNCRCDDFCYFYNDCCYHMIEKLTRSIELNTDVIAPLIRLKVQEVENTTLMLRKDLIACIGNEYRESAFIMVSRCDDMPLASKDVIDKCESANDMYSIRNIPVDHIVDGKVVATYINVYCALCNGVSENETEFWTVDISCNVENVEVISQMELEEIEKLDDCVIRPKSRKKNALRQCFIGENFIETCDKTYTNEIKSLCQSYVYPGTIGDSDEVPIYKNPHCAFCYDKNVNVRDLNCAILYFSDPRYKPGFIETPVNLQVIFDFSREKGLVSNVQCVELVKCQSYEIYDCASKRCRQLYCPRGKIPHEGKCIKFANVTSSIASSPVVDTFRPIDRSIIGVNLLEISEIYILELSSENYAHLVLYAMGETSENIMKTIHNTIESIYGEILEIEQMKECPCLKIKRVSGDYDMITDLFSKLVLYFENLEAMENRGYSLIPSFTKIRNFHSLESLDCATGYLVIDTNPFVVTDNLNVSTPYLDKPFFLPSHHMVVYKQNSMWEIVYNASFGILPKMIATCDNRPRLNCSMVTYDIHEVAISNTSVEIINSSLLIQQNEFATFQNKIFICSDKISSIGSFVNFFSYSAHHRILSLVTSAISALSASIVVVAHCCVKRLRNIHGLNISALSVSAVLMHLLLIASSFIEGQTLCVIYAVALHFVILDIFMWMNIIGFDITRSLSSDKPISQTTPYKKFLGYIFLSLAFPILIMTVSVSLEFTESRFKPDYGQNGVCWLSNGRSILIFVIGPVVFSLFFNFSFSAFTIKSIYSKAKESKFARNRSYFVVYIKLSLILGLTWIFGIVGAVAELEWLWIVHIVINGLHGFSLMICSLVNVRMLRQLRNSMKTSTQNSYNSKSAATENSNI